jgi:hypothetical protein
MPSFYSNSETGQLLSLNDQNLASFAANDLAINFESNAEELIFESR